MRHAPIPLKNGHLQTQGLRTPQIHPISDSNGSTKTASYPLLFRTCVPLVTFSGLLRAFFHLTCRTPLRLWAWSAPVSAWRTDYISTLLRSKTLQNASPILALKLVLFKRF